jgi:hypothetical protein
MRKTAIIVLLVLLLGAGLLYAASGNLIVMGWLGVGGVTTPTPGCAVDVAGNVNVTGSYKINGVALSLPSVLTGAACGLRIANDATSPTTKIDVTANMIGTVVPSGTIVIDCTHSGQATGNDLDTGTRQASKWYYIWVIYNGTTLAGLASLSSTSPVMPSGYTYKSLVGVAVTDSSAHFKVFSQVGNHFVYDEYQEVSVGSTAQSWTTQNYSAFIPPISTRAFFQLEMWIGGGQTGSRYGALRMNGSSSTVGHYMGEVSGNNTGQSSFSTVNDWINTDSSQSIQLFISTNVNEWYLRVLGFELNL